MPSREEWIAGGIIAAVLAGLGITLFVVLKRKKSSGYTLRRVDRQPILTNFERVKLVRNREGYLDELVIHREIHE
jgi:hypothetical protein